MSVSLRFHCLLLPALWLACGVGAWSADAPDDQAINASAKTAQDKVDALSKNVLSPKSKVQSPGRSSKSDPLFDVESKWRVQDDVEAEVQAVKRGGAVNPREEPEPKPKPLPATPVVNDPEQVRAVPDSDEAVKTTAAKPNELKSAPAATQVKPRSTLPAPADPEAVRAFEGADNETVLNKAGQASPPIRPQPAVTQKNAPQVLDEGPRFESNNPLDKDEPKPAVAVAPEKKTEPVKTAAAKETNTTVDPATNAAQALLKEAGLDAPNPGLSTKLDLPVSLKGARDFKQPGAVKPGAAGGKNADPEQQINELVREINLQREQLKKLWETEKKKIGDTLGDKFGVKVTGEHEKKVLLALLEKMPLGAVAVKVFDPKTKQALPARVKLVDMTETTARAPLSEGFWCRGNTPGIQVISGLVRAEISHGGRFFPPFIKGLKVSPGMVTPLEVPMARPAALDFEARGWVLADLDIGLRARPGETKVWFGAQPSIHDLILGARAEGVRVLGISLPLGDAKAMAEIQNALVNPTNEVLLLPVFPGPRNAFNGSGMGLGVESWEGLKPESIGPDAPLRDGFDAIRANGGLAVYKDLRGSKTAQIERDLLPAFKHLKHDNYFHGKTGPVQLFGATELPFDTITAAYDLLALDGSEECEAVWFNLLNEGAPVRVIGAGGGSLEGGRIPFGQTFIQMDGKLSRENVLEAVQAGRTMVSFGPAAFCRVFERDMGPGSVLPTDGRQLTLQIQAYSSMSQGAVLDKIEIVRNGKVVHVQSATAGDPLESEIHDLRWPFSEKGNAWYIVRVTERLKNPGGHDEVLRRAWTSPIYFRGATFAAPKMAMTRVHGVLRKGLTPIRGTVTALALGQEPMRVESGADGKFSITLPASGSLVFKAPECEPVAKRVFEHPRVQRELGRQLTQEDPLKRLSERAVFGVWRLQLSELEWDVTLAPEVDPPEPEKLPAL